ncbi:uncharacterized protein At5g01610 [Sorghum bicolor]|uniref:Uncharacterized protein n=1 Tax=Sorghum bicolor TaxID=4558 RepID=C5Y851_SORBI|nr:uncharacterized protein At5g01610 [Sorghum bicolor]EES08273.1 hypothetical protein SORBI_3005G088300 [Sorghum bicolor]|eukprot:XP_002449285.1 uncharacterized protein At5g01610 [Sorghum bicolor]
MARNHHFVLAVFLMAAAGTTTTTTTATSPSGNSTPTPTAYEMLERYDFPRGILPEGVQRYELRPDDGSFEVFLSGRSCEFRVGDRYLLRYDRRISGTAREGSIRALQGVSVKVLFVWLAITEVDRAGDQLSFLVGPLAASFPTKNFAESPRCQCGFDCAYVAGDAAAATAVAAS